MPLHVSERSNTIAGKLVGGLLALLVVGLLVFVSCGVPGGSDEAEIPDIGELDGNARSACELYTPIAGDIRSEQLTGPRLFRALQDVYNVARRSETVQFEDSVRVLLNAAIAGDEPVRDEQQDRLDEACARA